MKFSSKISDTTYMVYIMDWINHGSIVVFTYVYTYVDMFIVV